MKTLLLCIVAMIINTTAHSQESDTTKTKNIKRETVTRVVTVKDTAVSKTVTEKLIEEQQIIKIEDTGEENQDIEFSKDKNETIIISDDVKVNKTNEELIQVLKEEQQKEIEESRKQQLLKAQEERKIIDQRKEVQEMKRLQRKKDSLNRIKNDQS